LTGRIGLTGVAHHSALLDTLKARLIGAVAIT
jgi:hypothetical protein